MLKAILTLKATKKAVMDASPIGVRHESTVDQPCLSTKRADHWSASKAVIDMLLSC